MMLALFTVFACSASAATVAGHGTCAGDVQDLLQTSKATKLQLETLPANTCTFTDSGSTFPEEPWPCNVSSLKFSAVKAINTDGEACEDQRSKISVLNVTGGNYITVCRVRGVCLNACGISPIDNFLYCEARNTESTSSQPGAADNSLVRITCPGLSSVASFDPPFSPVQGFRCYIGGQLGNTRAGTFDMDGSYYWREGQNIYKMTDANIKTLSVSTVYIDGTNPINNRRELVKNDPAIDFADFVVVKEDLFGAGTMNYVVGCRRGEVVIQNVDNTAEATRVLALNMINGIDTGGGSGSQWYYHGTSRSFCAYDDAQVVVAVLLDEINEISSSVLGAVVSASLDTSSRNDGMNCLMANPAPFPDGERVTCPNGVEEFTFADSPPGQLTAGQNLSDNIFVKMVDDRQNTNNNQDCLGAAILTPENAAASAIPDQSSGAPLLIFSSIADNGAGKVGPCNTGNGDQRPIITLGFHEPVDILSFELWNNFESRPNRRAAITWRVAGGGEAQITPPQGTQGGGQSVLIFGGDPLPLNVTEFEFWVGDLPGLKSFRFCKRGGSDVGDPHIQTLDGHHYTFLRQGTFLLWSFSHHTQIPSDRRSPVDWQLYAHYSGHASYTKGLLLLDSSVPSMPYALELTAHDCKWRSRKGHSAWKLMEKPELLRVQTGAEYLTAVKVMWNASNAKYYQLVKLHMNSLHGMKQIATLHISCHPNHNINTNIVMERAGDSQFVRGQVGVTSKRTKRSASGISALQTGEDQEFMRDVKWTGLGGSSIGETYLNSMDERGLSLMDRSCSSSDKANASEICTKHLGKPKSHEMESFADCVYDVCTGGGELAAELMAVVMNKSKE